MSLEEIKQPGIEQPKLEQPSIEHLLFLYILNQISKGNKVINIDV